MKKLIFNLEFINKSHLAYIDPQMSGCSHPVGSSSSISERKETRFVIAA